MNYALIIFLSFQPYAGSGAASSVIHFDRMQTCEDARETLISGAKAPDVNKYGRNFTVMIAKCVKLHSRMQE